MAEVPESQSLIHRGGKHHGHGHGHGKGQDHGQVKVEDSYRKDYSDENRPFGKFESVMRQIKQMVQKQADGSDLSQEDYDKLKKLMFDIKPEEISKVINFWFDCMVNFCVVFSLICMFAWQGGYLCAMKRIMTSQKKLEDWFMGPEVAAPPQAAQEAIPIVNAPAQPALVQQS